MALKKTVMTFYGLEAKDAYHRVEGVSIVGKEQIEFQVRSSLDGIEPNFADVRYECVYDIQGDNPIRQAYKHIKKLPEFTDAIDC